LLPGFGDINGFCHTLYGLADDVVAELELPDPPPQATRPKDASIARAGARKRRGNNDVEFIIGSVFKNNVKISIYSKKYFDSAK